MTDQEDLSRVIQIKTRRLQKIKEKEALLGNSTPPEISIEREDLESEIQELTIQLESLVTKDGLSHLAAESNTSPKISRYPTEVQKGIQESSISKTIEGLSNPQLDGEEKPNIFRDPIWQMIGVFVAVLALLFSVYVFTYENNPFYPLNGKTIKIQSREPIASVTFSSNAEKSIPLPTLEVVDNAKSDVSSYQQTIADCSLPTHLHIGDVASMNDTVPNRVRDKPQNSSTILGLLNQFDLVTVTDGPRCVVNQEGEKWVYWKINTLDKNLEGWTPEGDTVNYWLVPLKIVNVRFCYENELIDSECIISREVFTTPVTQIFVSWKYVGFTNNTYTRRWSNDGYPISDLMKTYQIWGEDNAPDYTWVKHDAGLSTGLYSLEFFIRDNIPPLQTASFSVQDLN